MERAQSRPLAGGPAISLGVATVLSRWRDPLAVFGMALGLRLLFSLLLANTFDVDEFVYLALGRDVAHGAILYRDITFFHPPGILVLLSYLNPLTALWWPLARLVQVLIDSVTAVLVWRLGVALHGRRTGLIAGILYAAHPVVLLSAVRVDQEVPITLLGVAGITLLITRRSNSAAVLAGACLAAACWIKYPMLVFLPAYLLAASRRRYLCLAAFLITGAALFWPYLGSLHQLYVDTVAWQTIHRIQTPLPLRLTTTAIFWLLVNPFAVMALGRERKPLWLIAAFSTGCIFVFTASAYPHYFTPVAPFGAVLGASIARRYITFPSRATMAVMVAGTVAWGGLISLTANGGESVFASSFTDVNPVVQYIDHTTRPGTPILASGLEYAYLAHRPNVDRYFWNLHDIVSAQSLERRLPPGTVVVLYPPNDPLAYPQRFTSYLNAHYARLRLHQTSVWLIQEHRHA